MGARRRDPGLRSCFGDSYRKMFVESTEVGEFDDKTTGSDGKLVLLI